MVLGLNLCRSLENWDDPEITEELFCGTFEVSGMAFSGPPDEATIEAVSVGLQNPVRREIHTKAWENTTLYEIATDIAAEGDLSLVLEIDDIVLDRVDQRQEADLYFLTRLAKKHGASVKVMSGQLIIFRELDYEEKESVITIQKGDKRLLSYNFTQDSSDVCASASVTYSDPKSGKVAHETFIPQQAPAVGKVLNVNARPPDMRGDRYRNLAIETLQERFL
jgi:hypothetical protein